MIIKLLLAVLGAILLCLLVAVVRTLLLPRKTSVYQLSEDTKRIEEYADKLLNEYNLQVGDEICIPTKPTRPERTYVVNAGDTIQRVLQALDVDFDTLSRWNPMLLDVELPEGLIVTLPFVQPRNNMDDMNDVDDFDDMDDNMD